MIDPVEDRTFRVRLRVLEKSVALLLAGLHADDNRRWLVENGILDGLEAGRAENARREPERSALRRSDA